MEETTNVEILQINTQQAQTSVKDLKQQVKDLKDALLNLDQGTQEYNDTLLKLGDAQHQLKEINEQMRQTTTDFGDRVGNVSKTIAGMSGAISAVTASLSLMGIQIGDDAKLMKVLVAAMSITQGLTAIDAGIKSFKALRISIQAATAAQKGFNLAALKNPYLIAGAAIVGAVVAVTKAITKQRTEERARHEEAMQHYQDELEKQRGLAKERAKALEDIIRYERFVGRMTAKELDAESKKLQEDISDNNVAIKKFEDRIEAVQQEINKNAEYLNKSFVSGKTIQLINETTHGLQAQQDAYRENIKSIQEDNKLNEQKLEIVKNTTPVVEQNIKANSSNAKSAKDVYTEYERMMNAINLAAVAGEDEAVTLQRKIQVENLHLQSMKEGNEEYDKQLIKIAELQANYDKLIKTRSADNIENKKVITEYANELATLRNEYELMKTERDSAKSEPNTYEGIEEKRDMEIALETMKTQVHQSQLDAQHEADITYWDARLAMETEGTQAYNELMYQKNITEQTYMNESLRLQQELEDKKTTIQQDAQDKRRTLTSKYVQAIGGMVSEIGGLFDAIADSADDNYKLQKGLMVAGAILSTLASAAGALYSVWTDPSITSVWVKIAMTVATVASVMATGFALVSQMKAVKPTGGNSSSPRATAVTSLAAPISNVRQTQTHNEEGYVGGDQQDQRVVLVYSDLEAVGSNKANVQQSTTF